MQSHDQRRCSVGEEYLPHCTRLPSLQLISHEAVFLPVVSRLIPASRFYASDSGNQALKQPEEASVAATLRSATESRSQELAVDSYGLWLAFTQCGTWTPNLGRERSSMEAPTAAETALHASQVSMPGVPGPGSDSRCR